MTPTRRDPTPSAARNLEWQWDGALLGAVYALPAALAMPADVRTGLTFAVGVLPAAISGLPATRKARRSTAVLGALVGAAVAVGSILSHVPVLAVAALFGLGVGVVALANRGRAGQIAMVLGLPMVAVGLSYSDTSEALGIALLMLLGSIYAAVVSLLWPARPAPPSAPTPPRLGLDYGVRLGAAGATAAAIGFALDLDHIGWAGAAALLVMRPAAEMQRLRSIGRLVSVVAGALAAIVWLRTDPATIGYSLVVVAALAAAAATRASRWYITSAFSTFIVFLLLLHSAPEDATGRFNERVLETALGVGIAYFFGLAVPRLTRLRGTPPRA